MEIRINPGCGEIFNAIRDLEHHMRYRCGNQINPLRNNMTEGVIKRNAPFGFGAPPEAEHSFNGKIFFIKSNMKWCCTIRNYPRNEYRRHQVYGHVRAQRCYSSRQPNERRNIPRAEQFQDPYDRKLPGNLAPMAKFALNIERFRSPKPTPQEVLR